MKKYVLLGIIGLIIFALISLIPAKKPATESKYLTIKGSDTMVHLVSAWSEAFMKDHPEIDLSVTGGGSGTGIAALINNTTDIASASREMKDKEIAQAKENSVIPQEVVVARDGIAIVVNPENPVKDLTMDQLKKIFTGAYTNWKQLGGPDKEILVLSRESNSGTYVFFQEHVLKKEDFAQSVRLMTSTSAIIQSASSDLGVIGYAGLGYAKEAGNKVKIVGVKKTATSPSVKPSEETINSGAYPVSRPLYLYIKNSPSPSVKEFINFCLSSKGQQIVREMDYIPVK